MECHDIFSFNAALRLSEVYIWECPRFISGCATVKFAPSFYHVLPKTKAPKTTAEAKVTECTPQKEGTGAVAAVSLTKSAPAVTVPKNTGNNCLKWPNVSFSSEEKQVIFVSPPAYKRKRRRNRWSSGFITKKKYTSSPHTSRDESLLASDEDNGDDEDAEKEGGASRNNYAGKNGESVPRQLEQQEQSEENKAANEKSESEPANINKDREVEGDTQEPSNTEKSDGTSSQKQNKLDNNEASMEEAQQNGQAEPAEVAAAEATTAGTSKGAKRDDGGKGWGPSQRLYCDC